MDKDLPEVLIVSASMGAGHDGAARELSRRLADRGYAPRTVDFLELMPLRIGTAMRSIFEIELKVAPVTYQWLYRLMEIIPIFNWFAAHIWAGMARFRLRRLIRPTDAVIVATYPLAAQCLGDLRRSGKIAQPVVTFLTDYSVHPIWVNRNVDLHLAVHPVSAELALRLGAKKAIAVAPLTGPGFGRCTAGTRAKVRHDLELPDDAIIALLVAGSWGVGDVTTTAEILAADDRITPLVVCGRNDALREKLAADRLGVPLGWRSDMPELMAAADVLVQNAGGLACGEAFASHLPVLTYGPIPGHGLANAEIMDEANVARWVRRPRDLAATVVDAARGDLGRVLVANGDKVFATDAADEIAGVAAAWIGAPASRTQRFASSRWRPLTAAALAIAAVMLVAWTATAGVSYATSRGAFTAPLAETDNSSTYLVVRADLASPLPATLIHALQADHAAVALTGAEVRADPTLARTLADAGIPVVNAGTDVASRYHPSSSTRDLITDRNQIARLTGQAHVPFLPSRRVDALDVTLITLRGEMILRPTAVVSAANSRTVTLGSGVILLRAGDAPSTLTLLESVATRLPAHALAPLPLSLPTHQTPVKDSR